MRAIVVNKGNQKATLADVPIPERGKGEALIRTLYVGIDGSDLQVIRNRAIDRTPPEDDYIILGHEAVGVVEDSGSTSLTEGEIVVPTVRRPKRDDIGKDFSREKLDRAPSEVYNESGIRKEHGFMSEFFTAPEEDLVVLPKGLARYGHLVEPASIIEKTIELSMSARKEFNWTPNTFLIFGSGRLGVLAAAIFTVKSGGGGVYVYGAEKRPNQSAYLVEDFLDGQYIYHENISVDEISRHYETADLAIEASGKPAHVFEGIRNLDTNGILITLGLPLQKENITIRGSQIHRELTLHNKAIMGAAKSNQSHFREAIKTLSKFPDSFFESYITETYSIEEYEEAFKNTSTQLKTVIQFDEVPS